MSSERWQRIQRLFEAALAEPNNARTSFLESAGGDYAELRAEVVALVAAHERWR
jgi:hypothetical protein